MKIRDSIDKLLLNASDTYEKYKIMRVYKGGRYVLGDIMSNIKAKVGVATCFWCRNKDK